MRLIEALRVINPMHTIEIQRIAGNHLEPVYNGYCISVPNELVEAAEKLEVCEIAAGYETIMIHTREEEQWTTES